MNWSSNTPNTVTAKMILASIAMIKKHCLACFTSYNRNKFKLLWVLLMHCRFWCVIDVNGSLRIRRGITVVWNTDLGVAVTVSAMACIWWVNWRSMSIGCWYFAYFSKLWICKNVPVDCGEKGNYVKKSYLLCL